MGIYLFCASCLLVVAILVLFVEYVVYFFKKMRRPGDKKILLDTQYKSVYLDSIDEFIIDFVCGVVLGVFLPLIFIYVAHAQYRMETAISMYYEILFGGEMLWLNYGQCFELFQSIYWFFIIFLPLCTVTYKFTYKRYWVLLLYIVYVCSRINVSIVCDSLFLSFLLEFCRYVCITTFVWQLSIIEDINYHNKYYYHNDLDNPTKDSNYKIFIVINIFLFVITLIGFIVIKTILGR